MDLYLYFDNIVYPQLNYILSQYKLGKITKEVATNIVTNVCDIKDVVLDHAKSVAPIMCKDALTEFLTKIEEVC